LIRAGGCRTGIGDGATGTFALLALQHTAAQRPTGKTKEQETDGQNENHHFHFRSLRMIINDIIIQQHNRIAAEFSLHLLQNNNESGEPTVVGPS